ncbi:GNAT family N-acetyltransferase [Pseudomonas vanderleydeniana]|uniref:GNAT family N-acetyltransferase n=1 Tax=Pseudomonas vanderleydeniana TaxID=2745495 RepID=A0A9E6PHX5_9PSED|nr:GNAT family N-acetyltransferase [Pseudomonas vanderleydeniana]QXI26886.1 GNAT family N-acetyltransferase [Pseudomonas vanderleydeniana]
MDTAIDIRPAIAADAGIISRILQRSIRVGCSRDHRNEPARLEAWIRTRSIGHVLPWLADPRLYLNLAHWQGKPAGVGMARDDGRILLCYVQPEWFRRGIARALVAGLERWLTAAGHGTVRLNSTLTAEGFYRHLGYRQTAQSFRVAGFIAIPMHKPLV